MTKQQKFSPKMKIGQHISRNNRDVSQNEQKIWKEALQCYKIKQQLTKKLSETLKQQCTWTYHNSKGHTVYGCSFN